MKKILDQIDIGISELLLIVMTSLAFANVLSRYVIHASISFTDELTSSLFVLFSLLGHRCGRNRSIWAYGPLETCPPSCASIP
jgi:C4-dicarboxylate transporter DctQ subunit